MTGSKDTMKVRTMLTIVVEAVDFDCKPPSPYAHDLLCGFPFFYDIGTGGVMETLRCALHMAFTEVLQRMDFKKTGFH